MNINFAGKNFWLDFTGILFWPEKSLAVVSDLHLEKGSHFAMRGFFLPPYDSRETLNRLHNALARLSPRKIILLGDSFHDARGYERLPPSDREQFHRLTSFDPVWILGNHDNGFVPPGFSAHHSLEIDGVTFVHESGTNACEISGHYHPKADITHKEAKISRPCFIEDGQKMVLPSFGSYTGGLAISHPAIKSVFSNPTRAYMLGESKIYFLGNRV